MAQVLGGYGGPEFAMPAGIPPFEAMSALMVLKNVLRLLRVAKIFFPSSGGDPRPQGNSDLPGALLSEKCRSFFKHTTIWRMRVLKAERG